MKRLILTFVVLFAAALASAQETYSITIGGTTANRASLVGQIELGRTQKNADVCARGSLPPTCTQAQACVALSVEGGASCAAAAALAADARIYPNSLAGREAFVANELIRTRVGSYLAEQNAREAATFKAWCAAANQVQKNVVCAASGMPDGCNPCGQ